MLFDLMSVQTFWKILLFLHFLMAVGLLAGVTLQSVAVLLPARQAAGHFIAHFRPLPTASYALMIILLYVPQALMGAWIYAKYRTYVRIPMEAQRYWWTVRSIQLNEHVVTKIIALLPAYWLIF